MIKKFFIILSISVFSSMLGVGIVGPLLPIYAERTGANGIWIGIIFASFSVSRTIFAPIIGGVSDQKAKKKVFLCVGLFVYSLISLGYVWASSVLDLTIIRVLQGSAAGMIIPIAQAYIGDLSPEGEEGTWMGYFNVAFFTGFGFGPLMGGVLIDHFSINTAFYAMGVFNLLAFFLVLFLPNEVTRKRKIKRNLHNSFTHAMKSGVIKGTASFRLVYAFGRGTFSCFLPIIADFYLGLNTAQIGCVVAINILFMAGLQIPCGKIADRFSRKRLIVLGSLINLSFIGLIPLMQSFWQLVVLCLIGSVGGALCMPAASALVVEEGRKYGMGLSLGIFTMAMSVGSAIGPIISGLIYDFWEINSVFFVASCLMLLGTGLFIWFTMDN